MDNKFYVLISKMQVLMKHLLQITDLKARIRLHKTLLQLMVAKAFFLVTTIPELVR